MCEELLSKSKNTTKLKKNSETGLRMPLLKRDGHCTLLCMMNFFAGFRLIKRFLPKIESFLELGSGDCALSLRMTKYVKQVYAVDVSKQIIKDICMPANFQLFISDGSTIPIPDNSIDLAYSNQLMEHLHPDDASNQLKNIYSVLNAKGKYICITPNRFSGPHDISRYFDNLATGFHLKEYTLGELSNLFRDVGFSNLILYAGGKGIYIRFPLPIVLLCEKVLSKIPSKFQKALACFLPIRAILGIILIGLK